MTRIGWIGVGAMGSPMAGLLADAGHEVRAYDTDAARLAALAGRGVVGVTSAREAAMGAEVLALMVATPAQVETVLYGENGACEALAPGSLAILMATVGPESATRWGIDLAGRDVALVDAPVSGGVRRAELGDLLAMVGADAHSLERARPLLEVLASTVAVVGTAVGDGQKVKLVNQLLGGVHIAVAAEALAFAEALGLDPLATFEVVRHGAANSFMLEDRGDRMTREAFTDVRSALDIWVKDLGLVVDAAEAAKYETPLARTAAALYLAGQRAGLGRLDDSVVLEVLRNQHKES